MKSFCKHYSWMLLCGLILLISPITETGATDPVFGDKLLPANGRQETLLSIPAFGRYSLIVKSDQGTALRYINKMSGPSAINGSPGQSDGRIDAFLDTGNYKVVTYADEQGSGDVTLSATPFSEANGKTAPELIEYKLVSTELSDFEQRSYWINVKKRRTVLLEAAGRSLGDLRIWRNGSWLLDVNPDSQTIEPDIGKPLTVQRLSADLNPGSYLVVAYGGRSLPWARTASEQPFHLRMGIPELAGNGVDHKITSPFGYDRWLVPASTDYYRLELKKTSPASIAVARFDRNYKFSISGRSQFITKESRLPVAEVFTSKGNKANREVVTIRASASQPYIFQRFSAVRHKVIKEPGNYWVSTLHSGYGEDSVDATSVLTDRYQKEKYVDSRTIELTNTLGWQRRFNVLNTLTLHFEVKQQGTYRVEADGIEGRYRFEPFTTLRGKNYKTPKARKLGDDWSLDRGFYILTLMPDGDAKSVATVSVYPESRRPTATSPAHIASRYKSVKVERNHRYTLYLNQQPGVTSGILVRRYPIDLSESMPLTLGPEEKLFLSIKTPSRGELVAQIEDGNLAVLRLKKPASNQYIAARPGSNRYPVDGGRYELSIHNQSDQSRNFQLQFTDTGQLESTPLPDFDLSLVRRIDFPELNNSKPHYLDMGKQQWSAYNVIVKDPGLYRLESTGLLETRGIVRTRVITQLDEQTANGMGRNFLIQQYLREGDYQLALSTEGDTQGHLGVQLSKTSLINGGKIKDGVAARHSLPSAEGLLYTFEIEKTGRYQLKSFGTNGYINVRLEDSNGWPLLKPGISADLDLELHAGKYRLVVLPTTLPARVVTLLSRIEKPPQRDGHGPFAMNLNKTLYPHTWYEPDEGEIRQPDRWTFELPAPAKTTLTLSLGMQASLIALKDNLQPLAFSAAKPLQQTLPAGKYRIEATSSRKNNRLDYTLGFSTAEQLVGQRRTVTVPVDIDISIGHDSLIEISSFGQQDVKAKIFDTDNNLLDSNDDRDNDWNFDIIQSLPAGRYRLHVSPVGQSSAETSISLSEPETLPLQKLELPATLKLDNPLIHSFKLDLSASKGVFAVAAQSRDSISLTLEMRDGKDNWQTIAKADGTEALLLASIENNAEEDREYRLKIWSPEQRGAEISVDAQMLEAPLTTEQTVTQGAALPNHSLHSTQLKTTRIELNTPGMFQAVPQSTGSLFWAGEKNQQLQAYDGFITSAHKLWLVSLEAGEPIKADRVLPEDETLQFNVSASRPVWIDAPSNSNNYHLIVAESRVGLPGIALSHDTQFDARRSGAGTNSSMALIMPSRQEGNSQIRVWGSSDAGLTLPVRLKQYRFKQTEKQKLQSHTTDALLAPQSALFFDLDGNLRDLQFGLAPGVAAVLVDKGKVLRSFWSDQQSQSFQITSDADALLFFNTRSEGRALGIQSNAVDTNAIVSVERIFKRYFASAGSFDLVISNDNQSGDFVEVYGDQSELLIQNRGGQVFRGQRVPLIDDTVLNVKHGVGLVSVWLDSNERYAENSDNKTGEIPAQTQLSGSKQTIEFTRDKAGFISLQSSTPLITSIQRSGLVDQVKVFENGLKTTLFLPPGKSRLQLESTEPGNMHAMLRMTEVTPVPLEEGLGSRVNLLPGDARIYQFSLAKHQEVGIGVQSSIDVAQAYLYSQKGELIGKGVSQKHALNVGKYFLMIELPSDTSAGVELSPAIVGLESQDTGASKEIMLDYQQYSSPEAL